MPDDIMKLTYQIKQSIIDRMQRVMYLYPIPYDKIGIKRAQDLVSKGVDKRFTQFVKQQLKAYMVDGKEPAPAIATTIKNFADDMMAGRDITVRTGDYIAIQSQMQSRTMRK